MKRFILSALFFIALLSIWHLLVLAKVWSPVLLPDPISVWEYLKGAAEDGTLLQASLVTMRRLLAGYIIGIAVGLPLGLLTARYKFCKDTLGVLALGLQTLPSVCWVPLALLRRSAASASRARAHQGYRSEEHTSELQSRPYLRCRLLLAQKN